MNYIHIADAVLVLLTLAGLARVALSHLPKALEAKAAKDAAELENHIAATNERLNAQLIASVHGALLYFRTHAKELKDEFFDEVDYVESHIEQDGRFLHVHFDAILHAIEQVKHGLPLPPAETGGGPGVTPADVTGGGPGSPQPTP